MNDAAGSKLRFFSTLLSAACHRTLDEKGGILVDTAFLSCGRKKAPKRQRLG
jgi:hypothetical protein